MFVFWFCGIHATGLNETIVSLERNKKYLGRRKMNAQKDPLPKIPPFFEKKKEPPRKAVDTRGMLSIATMLVSLAAVTISMGGGAKLVLDILNDGLANNLDKLLVKIAVLGFSFFFGWGVGLVSIRGFGNLIYPLIIKIYTWGCMIAVGVLYIEIIQKLYMQKYDGMHFGTYLAILLGGLFVLLCLHLLVEEHDLRPFAIPLLIISVLHLFVIVFRYVFTPDAIGKFALGDFLVFLLMISTSGLMLLHIGILSPVREQIGGAFSRKQELENKENDG